MVYEIKPRNAHKGQVVEKFMNIMTFSGRRPVFIGDDITDEDGFRVCNAKGGISVRVGASDKPTNVEEVEDWLGHLVEAANGPNP
jgi:trehalose 6-phosphate phosphatase